MRLISRYFMRPENKPTTTPFLNAVRSFPKTVIEGMVKTVIETTEFLVDSPKHEKIVIKNKYALDVSSQYPFFCIYKNSPGSSQLSEFSIDHNPVLAIYKEMDELNTKSAEDIQYRWVAKFFVNPIDECDDTQDGQIRDLIDYWSQDEQLCVALGSFLHTQISSAKELKTFIVNLHLCCLFTQKLEQSDYDNVFVFFIRHFKNNFAELSK